MCLKIQKMTTAQEKTDDNKLFTEFPILAVKNKIRISVNDWH